jgi:predicted AAA+ superfamily ATPase
MFLAPWCGCVGGSRRRGRRQRTESLKDYIAELKDELEDAEERLRELQTRKPDESRG